jgi:hypothetical protein
MVLGMPWTPTVSLGALCEAWPSAAMAAPFEGSFAFDGAKSPLRRLSDYPRAPLDIGVTDAKVDVAEERKRVPLVVAGALCAQVFVRAHFANGVYSLSYFVRAPAPRKKPVRLRSSMPIP